MLAMLDTNTRPSYRLRVAVRCVAYLAVLLALSRNLQRSIPGSVLLGRIPYSGGKHTTLLRLSVRAAALFGTALAAANKVRRRVL